MIKHSTNLKQKKVVIISINIKKLLFAFLRFFSMFSIFMFYIILV